MQLRAPPPGFVDLLAVLPEARFHIGYHRADNFTGAPLPGYGAAGAWLIAPAADALTLVQHALLAEGLTLLIYDAYRPVRATRAMVAWALSTGSAHLLEEGYIARRSFHSRGIAVDLTLADRHSGAPLDMGTAWDVFHPDSHLASAVGHARQARLHLHAHMYAAGWLPFEKEWWHFNFPCHPAPEPPRLDVPYGEDEPPPGPIDD